MNFNFFESFQLMQLQLGSTSYATLAISIIVLGLAAILGKKWWWYKQDKSDSGNDEVKLVLGAILSLFGLLIGFLLTIAISGYNTRFAAEENEAIAIGNAFQRTSLLDTVAHQEVGEMYLQDYLSLRILFYTATDKNQRAQARLDSIKMQTKMWLYVSDIAKAKPNPINASILSAVNDLYTAQQKTMSSWRRQIPSAAWILLGLFALCSNFLIGYNIRGARGHFLLVMTFPALTTLALFMIAEIDVPGEGIIHVTPENLMMVRETVDKGGLAP